MVCKVTVRATSEDGTREDRAVEDLLDEVEGNQAGEPADLWQERDRMTETITVSGVEIDRIVEVEFEKPTGMRIRLVFNESPNHDGGGV